MMQRIRWTLLLLGIGIILVFSLYNSEPVTVQLPLMEDPKLPLSMLLLATAGVCFLFGSIMTAWMLRARASKKSKQAKQAAAESAAAAGETAPAS